MLLAEMDEEFGISDLVEEEFGSLSRPKKPVCSPVNSTISFSRPGKSWNMQEQQSKKYLEQIIIFTLF